MARTPLRVRLSIDRIHAVREGDGIGSAEPYLWAIAFKMDGESVEVGEDLHLRGTCDVIATTGSHGNLGVDDVDGGDVIAVPSDVGVFRTSLVPIPLSDALRQQLPDEDAQSGIFGLVLVLMEEDQVTDAGANAGYATLADFLQRELDRIIPTLSIFKQDVSDDEIDDLTDKAFGAVEAAIRHVQDRWENVWSFLDADDTIGFKLLRWRHDKIVEAGGHIDISERFQTIANQVVTQDWLVEGQLQAVPAGIIGPAHLPRSADVGAPLAAGSPTTCLHPASNVQNITYRAQDGRLHEIWRDGIGQIGTSDLTTLAGAPRAAGDPFAYLETPTDLQIVVFRADGGGVQSLYWSTGAVGRDDLSGTAGAPDASGNPVGTFNPTTGTHHIVYRGGGGHLHVLYWTGAHDPVHYEGPLTEMVDCTLAAGDPSAYFTPDGWNIVVYRGTDSRIRTLYWSTGAVGHDDLSGTAGTPPAVGDPVGYHLASGDVHQVTYRDGAGHLYELYWVGAAPVAGWDVTAAAGAPPAAGDPAVFYCESTNTKHIVYVGPSGHLFDISWVPGGPPTFVDLTIAALAPRAAAGRPSVFTLRDPLVRYAVFRGVDDQIHEIQWTAPGWETAMRQEGWRWCNKCQGLFFGPEVAASSCPAGGTHAPPEQTGSYDYQLPFDVSGDLRAQGGWRWCNKCQGLYFGPSVADSRCPAGGPHAAADQSGSADYGLPHGMTGGTSRQPGWRWCNKCQGLYYGPNVGAARCPAGDAHAPFEVTGSLDYVVPHASTAVIT